jgi:septal ring factor EnvC (AmiA/AmiB activator)
MNTSPILNRGRDVSRACAVGAQLGLLVLASALPGITRAETTVSDTRVALEKWVETRQQISKTRADWQADKESLEQTVALYERELQSVEAQMSKVSTNNTQVTKEAAEAEALKKSSSEAIERARQFANEFETRLKQLLPQLPAPLQDIVKPLALRMPADPANTRMLAAERVQVCVGALNELDKFNNAVNVFNEKRKNDKGEEVAVQTIYVGLGAAYFVNDTADFAGVGTPGAGGWQWSNQPDLAPAVQAALKIYRNEQTARFITLPVTIK